MTIIKFILHQSITLMVMMMALARYRLVAPTRAPIMRLPMVRGSTWCGVLRQTAPTFGSPRTIALIWRPCIATGTLVEISRIHYHPQINTMRWVLSLEFNQLTTRVGRDRMKLSFDLFRCANFERSHWSLKETRTPPSIVLGAVQSLQ